MNLILTSLWPWGNSLDVWAESSSCEVVKGWWLSLAAGLEVGAEDFELHFFLKREFRSKGLSLRAGPPPPVSSQDTTSVISFLSSYQRILCIYKEVYTSISHFHINGRVPGILSCITVSNTHTHKKVFPQYMEIGPSFFISWIAYCMAWMLQKLFNPFLSVDISQVFNLLQS